MEKYGKYNIDNFFVGELYLANEFGNLFYPNTFKKELNKIDFVTNGAIDIKKELIDLKKRIRYESVLTIFYKVNINQYLCLHDGVVYSLKGVDYCKGLIPLKNLLPKVGFNISEYLTFKESLTLFNYLFKNNSSYKIEKIYDKTHYDVNDLYIGYLSLLDKSDTKYYKQRYVFKDLLEKYILYKNSIDWLGVTYRRNSKNIRSELYKYEIFMCLFLKQKDKPLYNVQNFQFYNNGILNYEEYEKKQLGDSFYELIRPFKDVLSENGVKVNQHEITLPKALKLCKKYEKKTK